MVGGTVSAFFAAASTSGGQKLPAAPIPKPGAASPRFLMFFGFNATFLPQFVMGYLGMPRRYHVYAPEFQVYHVMSTAGAAVLGVATLLPFGYLTWSLFAAPRAAPQSLACHRARMANGLSPPPHDNFVEPPEVTRDPYDYHPKEGPQAPQGDAA